MVVKLIAAFLGAIVFSGAVHADAFSNEDAACTGICQVHDAAAANQAPPVARQAARPAAASRQAKRETTAARRVAGMQAVKG